MIFMCLSNVVSTDTIRTSSRFTDHQVVNHNDATL